MKSLLSIYTVGLLACTVMLLAAPRTVHAEGSPYRAGVTQTSLREALGGRSFPLLNVVRPRGGRAEQQRRLLNLLTNSLDRRIHVRNPRPAQVSDRSTTIVATDGSWYLQVVGDGSRFLYRGNVDDPIELEAARGRGPLDMNTLERLGREFVTQQLASLVSIPADERLVFLGTRYLREGSASLEDQKFTSEVVANIAIFGREVRGTYVAGPGSKIAVWFSNSGEPVGFDVDWPAYRVLPRTQATLLIDQVRNRLFAYTDSPRDLIERNTTRFECGYVDLGVHKRRTIQTGCLVHHDGDLPDGFKYASIETVPIGVPVVVDPVWGVTRLIARGQPWDLCKTSKTICKEPSEADDLGE